MPRGSHQFQRPIRRMAAGTMTSLTIVASIAMAMAVANPSLLDRHQRNDQERREYRDHQQAAPEISGAVSTSP